MAHFFLLVSFLCILSANLSAGKTLVNSFTPQVLIPNSASISLAGEKLFFGKSEQTPEFLLKKADSLLLKGNIEEAITLYKQGLLLSSKENKAQFQRVFQNKLAWVYYWTRDLKNAKSGYQKTLALNKEVNTLADTLAIIEARVYTALIDDKRDTEVEVFEPEKISDSPNYLLLKAHAFLLKGTYDAVVISSPKAWDLLDRAEKLFRQQKTDITTCLFLVNYYKAVTFKLKLDFAVVKDYLLPLYNQLKVNPAFRLYYYSIVFHLGTAYSYLGDYKTSIQIFEKNIPELGSMLKPSDSRYFLRLGYAYQRLGNLTKTLMYFKKAEMLANSDSGNFLDQYRVYLFLNLLYSTDLPDIDNEFYYLKKASHLVGKIDEEYSKFYIEKLIGKYYRSAKDYNLSAQHYTTGLANLERTLNSDELFYTNYYNGILELYSDLLVGRMNTFYFQWKSNPANNSKAIYKSYNDTKLLVDLRLRMFVQNEYEKSKLVFIEELRSAYNSQIAVGEVIYNKVGDSSNFADLFRATESSKGILLRSFISNKMALEHAGIPIALRDQLEFIQQSIDTLQYKINKQDDVLLQSTNEIAINEILILHRKYNEQIKKISAEYPDFAMSNTGICNLNPQSIQNKLPVDKVFIEYHLHQHYIYIFLIDKTHRIFKYIYSEPLFSETIQKYRKLLTKLNGEWSFTEEEVLEFKRLSCELYAKLIQPIEKEIENKRLLIVPDDELNYIPFESLITQPFDSISGTQSLQNIEYLVYKNPISYLYSANQIIDNSIEEYTSVQFAGISPDYSQSGDLNNLNGNKLSILPGTSDELNTIYKDFPGKLYLEKNASKGNFFKAGSKYDILHLAMHTLLDTIEPMNTKLLFSNEIEKEDMHLHAYEIYSKKYASNLVVLSACNTSNGVLNMGEGVYSITRTFLLAGVRNIISTNWSVADKSSSHLMSYFYSNLAEGMPTDIALQKAKIKFIQNVDPTKNLPYFWAGYVSYGMPAAYHPARKYLALYIIIPSILFVLCFTVYYAMKKRLKT